MSLPLMSIEEKLEALREEWKKADKKTRAIIEIRAKLLKRALKKSGNRLFKKALELKW